MRVMMTMRIMRMILMIRKLTTPQSRRLVTARQRQELYSLNLLMTRLEKEAFTKVPRPKQNQENFVKTAELLFLCVFKDY